MPLSSEMMHLLDLDCVTQVTMTRAGSEYLQSLYDGNKEVLIFPTNFRFFSDYISSSKTINSNEKFSEDIIIEFIGKEFHRLKSRYFKEENLNKLGKLGNDCIDISIIEFIKNFKSIIESCQLNNKNIFLALYGSYHKSIGRDIFNLKVIWHHAHYYSEALKFNEVFPNSKIIINIRNPFSIFYSIQKSYKLNGFSWYRYQLLETILLSIREWSSGSSYLNVSKKFQDLLFVRLEDLPSEREIAKISKYLGIGFDENNFISTWAGYEWKGDPTSSRSYKANEIWTKNRSDNGWKKGLSFREKFIIKSLFGSFMKDYSYLDKSQTSNKSFEVFKYCLYILFPLKTEIDFFTINYYKKKFKQYNKSHSSAFIIVYIIHEIFYFIKFRYVLLKLFLNRPALD